MPLRFRSLWLGFLAALLVLGVGACRSKVGLSGEASAIGDSAVTDAGAGPANSGALDSNLLGAKTAEDKAEAARKVDKNLLFARQRAILQAPKRSENSPIMVAVLPMVLDWEKGRSGVKAEDQKILEANQTFHDITDVIRAYLADQENFEIIPAADLKAITEPLKANNDKERRRSREANEARGPNLEAMRYPISLIDEDFLYRLHKEYKIPADVLVVPTVYLSMRAPAERGKLGKSAKELHFNTEFRIYSAYQMVDFGLETSYPLAIIEDSLAKISAEIQKIIVEKVGPYLPDRAKLSGAVF